MSFRKTLVFLAVFILLGGFYYFYEMRYAAEQEKAKETKKKLFALKQEDVAEITIEKDGQKVRAVEQGKHWVIKEPVATEADETAVTDLLTSLLDLSEDKALEGNIGRPEEYGFTAPPYRVGLKGRKESAFQTIEVGDATPTGGGFYLRRGSAAQILVAKGSREGVAGKDLFYLRNKSALTLPEPESITRIQIAPRDAASFELERKDTKEWRITKPEPYPADKTKVEQFLNKVKELKIEAYAPNMDLNAAGFNPPLLAVSFWTSGQGTPQTLLFGNQEVGAGGPTGYLAMRQGGQEVFRLATADYNAMPLTAAKLRDFHLFHTSNIEITRFSLQNEKGIFALERFGRNQMRFVDDPRAKVDNFAAEEFLYRLLSLKGDVVEPWSGDKKAAESGLSTPRAEIKLFTKKGEAETVAFGVTDPTGKYIYARRNQDPEVILFPIVQEEALQKSRADFENRRVFSTVDYGGLTGISIIYKSKEYRLSHKTEDWKLTSPRKATIPEQQVFNLIHEARELKFEEVLGSNSTADLQPALAKPEFTVKFTDKNRKEVIKFKAAVHPQNKDNYIVQDEISGGLYTVKYQGFRETEMLLNKLAKE